MKRFNLTLPQLQNIMTKENFVNDGSEGLIFRLPDEKDFLSDEKDSLSDEKDVLFKIYRQFKVPKNFVQKVEAFYNCVDLDDIIVRPQALLTVNKTLPIGVVMKNEGTSLREANLEFKEKVEALEQCKKIIIRLHEKGIILGDIKLENFLYKNGRVKICDILSAKIGQYEITNKNTVAIYHESVHHVVDENTDIQAFNYMTYLFLKYGDLKFSKRKFIHEFRKILQEDLQRQGVPYYYDNNSKDVLENIYQADKKEKVEDEFLLDHLMYI